jgi:CheY-like chemotaxis protein
LFAEEFSVRGVEVTAVSDVAEALKAVAASPPHVIFLDYRLPGTTGDEVAKKLPPEIPKYLVTGDIVVHTTYEFAGILRKPTDPKQILAVLESRRASL